MTTCRAALACLLLLLACAASAAARDVVHVRGRADVTDPDDPGATWVDITLQTALAGRRVVISAYDERLAPRVLLLRDDGSLRGMPEFDGPFPQPAITFYGSDIGGQTATIAASASLLLVSNSYGFKKHVLFGYRVGTYGGEVGAWQRCRGLENEYPDAVAVSGTAVAHSICDADEQGITVRDLGRPGSPPRRIYPPAGYRLDQLELPTVDMAGHFLALRSGTSLRGVLQVFDWRSGREVYRVPPTELSNDFSFAVQRDGKVVVTQRDNSAPSEPTNCEFHTPLTWYSPAEPRAHALPYRPCGPDLRMARGRIVYRGPGRLGSTLWMTDLDGQRPLRLSGTPWVLGFIEDLHPPFDFDGTRIAYGEPGCVDERVVRDTVAAIARRGYLRGMTCPVRFAGRHPISERRNGKLTARIACPSGCVGSWEVDTVGRHPQTLVDGGDLRVPAGATRVLTSTESALPRYQADRGRRRRRVRVVVTVEQPSGSIKTIARTVTILTTRDAGARAARRLRRVVRGRAGQ